MDGYPVDWTEGRSGAAAGADVGRKLVSAAGGFACTACHAVGSYDIVQSLDGRGVNLAYTGSRLLRPYFERWLRNPLRIDPATKMPAYFEGDQSPLTEYYGGDANRQIGAIWEYLQMGDRLPPPVGASGP
jgi:hypothetical protein